MCSQPSIIGNWRDLRKTSNYRVLESLRVSIYNIEWAEKIYRVLKNVLNDTIRYNTVNILFHKTRYTHHWWTLFCHQQNETEIKLQYNRLLIIRITSRFSMNRTFTSHYRRFQLSTVYLITTTTKIVRFWKELLRILNC